MSASSGEQHDQPISCLSWAIVACKRATSSVLESADSGVLVLVFVEEEDEILCIGAEAMCRGRAASVSRRDLRVADRTS